MVCFREIHELGHARVGMPPRRQVHSYVIRNGVEQDVKVGTSLFARIFLLPVLKMRTRYMRGFSSPLPMFCFTSNVGSTKEIFTGENREKHIEFQEN
jgi:hypothetical protein